MFVRGVPTSVVEMQLGMHLTQSSSSGLHYEAKISRRAGRRKRANVEKRVVSRRHSLRFCMMVMQLWKLVGIILAAPGAMQYLFFPWGAIIEQSLSFYLLYVDSNDSMHSVRLVNNEGVK